MTRLMVTVGLLLLVGCGGGSSGPGGVGGAISSAPLAGKIGGQAWTLGTAESNSFLSDDTGFWVDAYSGSFTPCTNSAPTDGDRLILTLPTTTGTHSLGFNLTETFYVGSSSDNLAATSGTIVIDSITATTISGGAKFSYNADNSVDGQFTATICP